MTMFARPIADLRNPALQFTPNVLGPDGFRRSRWTQRYVDPDTEADFVAFAHRSRWGRAIAGGFVIVALAVYITEYHPRWVSAADKVGLVCYLAAWAYTVAGCFLSSEGVATMLCSFRCRRSNSHAAGTRRRGRRRCSSPFA